MIGRRCSQPRGGDAAHYAGPRGLHREQLGSWEAGLAVTRGRGALVPRRGGWPCLNNSGAWGPAGAPWGQVGTGPGPCDTEGRLAGTRPWASVC